MSPCHPSNPRSRPAQKLAETIINSFGKFDSEATTSMAHVGQPPNCGGTVDEQSVADVSINVAWNTHCSIPMPHRDRPCLSHSCYLVGYFPHDTDIIA